MDNIGHTDIYRPLISRPSHLLPESFHFTLEFGDVIGVSKASSCRVRQLSVHCCLALPGLAGWNHADVGG